MLYVRREGVAHIFEVMVVVYYIYVCRCVNEGVLRCVALRWASEECMYNITYEYSYLLQYVRTPCVSFST